MLHLIASGNLFDSDHVSTLIAILTAGGGIMMFAAFRAEKARGDARARDLDETRTALAEAREDRHKIEKSVNEKLAAMEARHREEIGLLRGRLDAVTTGWLNELGRDLGDRIADRIVPVIERRLDG